eukprot:scaffold182745_cov28-Tisochrysis_lutea.AAC.1
MSSASSVLLAELTEQLASSRAALLDARESEQRERELRQRQAAVVGELEEALSLARAQIDALQKDNHLLRRTLANTDQETYAGAALHAADDNLRLVEEGQRLQSELEKKAQTEQVLMTYRHVLEPATSPYLLPYARLALGAACPFGNAAGRADGHTQTGQLAQSGDEVTAQGGHAPARKRAGYRQSGARAVGPQRGGAEAVVLSRPHPVGGEQAARGPAKSGRQ